MDGFNTTDIDQCVYDSFGENEEEWKKLGVEADNTILREDQKEEKKIGIIHNPSITINGAIYKGDIDGPDIFNAICSSFKPKNRPQQCDKKYDLAAVLDNFDPSDLAADHYDPRTAKEIHIFMAVIAVILINACILHLYRKHQGRQMENDVEMHVQEHV